MVTNMREKTGGATRGGMLGLPASRVITFVQLIEHHHHLPRLDSAADGRETDNVAEQNGHIGMFGRHVAVANKQLSRDLLPLVPRESGVSHGNAGALQDTHTAQQGEWRRA